MVPSTVDQPTDAMVTHTIAKVHILTYQVHITLPCQHGHTAASQRWSATAVSIMNCEMMQLSSSKSQSYCAMYVKAVIVLIGPAHGLTFRSSSESPGSIQHGKQ